MRIGIDASNIRSGGGLTHLSELLSASEPRTFGVQRVVVWSGHNTLSQLPDRSWLERVHEAKLDGSLLDRMYWQRTTLPLLAKKSSDILFVPGGLFLGSFHPFVTMSQNLLPFEWRELKRYALSRQFVRLILLRIGQTSTFRNADGLIFLTKYAQNVISDQIDRLDAITTIIPHGISKRFFLPPRTQKPIDEYREKCAFRLLYVSTIDLYKHQRNVVEAVQAVRKRGWPVKLDLVGAAYGPALNRLRQSISRVDPTGSFVKYHGEMPFRRLHELYHRADAFVFASSCENMPNILLEAMAAGLPIACSNQGPMQEILDTGGIYFNPEDTLELSEVLRKLITLPELREKNAWRAYEEAKKYSWDSCAKRTFAFLANLVQGESCYHGALFPKKS